MSPILKEDAVSLAIDLIRLDGGTQPRANIDEDTVADYAAVWQSANGHYPFDSPCEVFHDGTTYWCTDGFHRILGAVRAKRASIQCVVHKGSLRDAIIYAAKCNSQHGLRRSAADKRHVVTRFLTDEEWKSKSNRWISEVCDVSHTLVSGIREQLDTSTGNVASSHSRTTGKDGKKRRRSTRKRKSKENVVECEVSKGAHSWESDGNGSRFCIHCKEDHPDNAKTKTTKPTESVASTHLTGIAKTIEHLRVKIDDIVRDHGKHDLTETILKDMDKALINLKKWAAAVKK